MLYKIVWAVHVINVILLIVVVLLQTGKGSEVGFAFGQGAAQTMFGSGGGKTFITRFTIILAVLFMGTSIFLALYQARAGGYGGVMKEAQKQKQQQQQQQTAPAVPAEAGQTGGEAVPADDGAEN